MVTLFKTQYEISSLYQTLDHEPPGLGEHWNPFSKGPVDFNDIEDFLEILH